MYPVLTPAFMAPPYLVVTDSATRVAALPGCWTLGSGRALSLRVCQSGELCVARGRVWITFDLAATDCSVRCGDYFLSDGESLQLTGGQSLVMESFTCGESTPAYFSWEPALNRRSSPDWQSGIAQPLRDLRTALVLFADAAGRFVRGLMAV